MRKLLFAVAASMLATIAGGQAQTFPSRPITIVVPFSAGGPTDASSPSG
jgi:tripartite-type tricarboxylate transporter receptor subunit TctC